MSVIATIKEERDTAHKNMTNSYDEGNIQEGEFWERQYNKLQDQVEEYYYILECTKNGTRI
tara:strand:+ start:10633 stop:10815 length:183 start_codon:yes stop_codon:yes gene_type:complete